MESVDIYKYVDTIQYRENVFLCNSHVYFVIELSVIVLQKKYAYKKFVNFGGF